MSNPMSQPSQKPEDYLQAGDLIDSGNTHVVDFTNRHRVSGEAPVDAAVRLYLAVRDEITYDPYRVGPDPRYFRASDCLATGRGFCIPKAALLAACARVIGIPARVGYADVRNHLSSKRLDELIGGNVYTWHSYTDLYLDGQWVKATPAFNKELCERFGVHVLEFDGRNDSLLQEFDQSGNRHMEYEGQRGVFSDVPYELILADFEKHHPRWLHNRADLDDELFGHKAKAGNDMA
ncbi:transglutaminase-like domain-containing protein [Sedimenticola selenatireducens]|uniref:transglutaminase-like domain-containing protein n=1 Tax=Sedimenticola selenatireducens TaxID=191960 RepID=UPI002AAB9421|nr:transglutaminase-like domain-containing protein [Sedimenticola selenatireducens]